MAMPAGICGQPKDSGQGGGHDSLKLKMVYDVITMDGNAEFCYFEGR